MHNRGRGPGLIKFRKGHKWSPRLPTGVPHDEARIIEDESGRRSAAQAAHQGRSAAHGGELRQAAGAAAAVSMARLWRDQGKRAAARDLLAPVYGWFTDGFDTLDLKEAKVLLDALAS